MNIYYTFVPKGNEQKEDDRINGTIEAWHLILKRTDHKEHRKRPDVFLKEHHTILLGRQLSYCDNMTVSDKRATVTG